MAGGTLAVSRSVHVSHDSLVREEEVFEVDACEKRSEGREYDFVCREK
jgi:hypothetical protein